MDRRTSRLSRLARALRQARKSAELELGRSLSRVADLQAQRDELETAMSRQAHLADLLIAGLAARVARIATQIAQEEHLLAALRERIVQYGMKQKLAEKRLEAAIALQRQRMMRYELDELVARREEARLRQGR